MFREPMVVATAQAEPGTAQRLADTAVRAAAKVLPPAKVVPAKVPPAVAPTPSVGVAAAVAALDPPTVKMFADRDSASRGAVQGPVKAAMTAAGMDSSKVADRAAMLAAAKESVAGRGVEAAPAPPAAPAEAPPAAAEAAPAKPAPAGAEVATPESVAAAVRPLPLLKKYAKDYARFILEDGAREPLLPARLRKAPDIAEAARVLREQIRAEIRGKPPAPAWPADKMDAGFRVRATGKIINTGRVHALPPGYAPKELVPGFINQQTGEFVDREAVLPPEAPTLPRAEKGGPGTGKAAKVAPEAKPGALPEAVEAKPTPVSAPLAPTKAERPAVKPPKKPAKTAIQKAAAVAEREARGPAATPAQKARAHIVAGEKGLLNKKGKPGIAYRMLAKRVTGQTSMANMTDAEATKFIDALERHPRPPRGVQPPGKPPVVSAEAPPPPPADSAGKLKRFGRTIYRVFWRALGRPAKPAELIAGREPTARALVAAHEAEAAQVAYGQRTIESAGKTVEQLHKWFRKQTTQNNRDFLLAYGREPMTDEGRAIQSAARARLKPEAAAMEKAFRELADMNFEELRALVGE
ncbi:MAG TPA: hypothetical protein VMY35_14575, partial [Phycisphaerae bacterium]|nr:hypothetical protein [Phycisphaerae bacterium]